jgi:hypothetical protein
MYASLQSCKYRNTNVSVSIYFSRVTNRNTQRIPKSNQPTAEITKNPLSYNKILKQTYM